MVPEMNPTCASCGRWDACHPDCRTYDQWVPRDDWKRPQPKPASEGGSTDYYTIPDGASDLLDLIEHKKMSFSLGNIFKACYRLGEKGGTSRLYDINKILFFAERMKAEEEKKGSQ